MQKIDTSEMKKFLISKMNFQMVLMETCKCGEKPVPGMINKQGEKVYMEDHHGNEIKLCVDCDMLKTNEKEKIKITMALNKIKFDEERRKKIGIDWGTPITTRDLDRYKYREDESEEFGFMPKEENII